MFSKSHAEVIGLGHPVIADESLLVTMRINHASYETRLKHSMS